MSFWETFPDAIHISAFSELKARKGDDVSSDLMWYVYHMSNPDSDHLRHLDPVKRSEELKASLGLTTKNMGLVLVKKAMEWYTENWLSPPARLVAPFADKIYQAEKVIRGFSIETPEDIKTFNETSKAFVEMKKTYDLYESSFKAGGQPKAKFGGGRVSAADDGTAFD